jgi:S-adenosylmethionine-diacylglycerol 3-amino-3-carboxypropyl transferase
MAYDTLETLAAAGPLRYGQCWEDADVLLEALAVSAGRVCLSIASAGDNTLALLSKSPGRVIALDRSAPQLACLELRVAAYQQLDDEALLELMGSRPSRRRLDLYRRCRAELAPATRRYWDERPAAVEAGLGHAGRFEGYLELFRQRVLPLVHSATAVNRLLQGGSPEERLAIYRSAWNTWRWRALLGLFCSRALMSRLGRDPRFFAHAQGSILPHVRARLQHVLTALDPADNPYLHWILTGRHGTALPYALRPRNIAAIRANIDRLEWRHQSLESFLAESDHEPIDCFNLSDVFEYMGLDAYSQLLERLAAAARPGARLAYWNMLVPRERPAELAARLRPLPELAAHLYARDRVFFYSRFVVEEVVP